MTSQDAKYQMNRAFCLALLFGMLIAPLSLGQEKAEFDNPTRADRISSQHLMAHIEYLASDRLMGRVAGTTQLEMAASYIDWKFQEIGLEPGGTMGFFQPFEFIPRARSSQNFGDPSLVRNVIGKLSGSGPNKDEWIVIGGHYDHVASRNTEGPDRISNGADDNASGTAGVIEIARLLKNGSPLNRSVLFVAFTAEEAGLLGSKHFVENPTVPLEKVVAMLNLDMIGRLHESNLQVLNVETGVEFPDAIRRLNEHYHFNLLPGTSGSSDHASFQKHKIPVMWMLTGAHPQVHQVGDHADLINAGGAVNIAQYTADIAYEISSWKARPNFQEPNPDNPGLHRQSNNGQLSLRSDGLRLPAGVGLEVTVRVSLSTNPRRSRGILSNLLGGGGPPPIPVTAVTPNSPAAKAGLQVGDLLTGIGQYSITDYKSLSHALSNFNPGDKANIKVVRDNEILNLEIQF